MEIHSTFFFFKIVTIQNFNRVSKNLWHIYTTNKSTEAKEMTHQTVATAANTMMKQMSQQCFRCHRYLIMSQRIRILTQSHTKMSASAEATCTCGSGGDDGRVCVHVFNEVLGHSLQFFHFPHIQGNTSAWDRNWAGGRRLCLHTHTHGQI